MLEFVCYAIRFAGAVWFGMVPAFGRLRVYRFLADVIWMLHDEGLIL
jgi:hypothetical protein